jgi:hypothetical protein
VLAGADLLNPPPIADIAMLKNVLVPLTAIASGAVLQRIARRQEIAADGWHSGGEAGHPLDRRAANAQPPPR